MRTLRALLPGVVAICALIGCASQPPPVAVSEVRPGDAAQVIEQRGHQLLPVYQFVLDGHQYAFAKAYSEGKTYDLIFIDAKLACSSQMPIDEVTRWEWVDEPDGLDYLVGRLRQACGLEPGTAPRTLSLNEDLEHPPEIDGSQLPVPSSEVADVAKEMGAHVAAGIAIIFAWPVLVPAALIYSASESRADAAESRVDQLMKAIILPVAETAIEEQLGTPSVKFVLSDTRTTVLQYAVKSGRAMYVGIVDGQVVWLHDRYPWLDRLAERAIEDQKNQRWLGAWRLALLRSSAAKVLTVTPDSVEKLAAYH